MTQVAANSSVATSNRPRAKAIRGIRQWIDSGQLRGGELLPPEEELAKRLMVGRTTIRTVLRHLEDEGLIIPKGRGRMVALPITSTTSTIATTQRCIVVLSDTGLSNVGNPASSSTGFSWHITATAVAAIQEAGLHSLILETKNWTEGEVERLAAERPSGVLLIRHSANTDLGRQLAQAMRRASIPVVVYGETDFLDETLASCDSLTSDHETGQYLATRHLVERGCKRIIRLWPLTQNDPVGPRPEWLAGRDRGYERAVREAGLAVLPPIEYVKPPESENIRERFQFSSRLMAGYLAEHFLGPTPPDGIVCVTDGTVGAAAAACRTLGRTPGVDVHLTGYDGYFWNTIERQFDPYIPACTLDKDNPRLGRELVRLLIDRLRGAFPPEPQHVRVEPRLVTLDQAIAPVGTPAFAG